VATGWQKCGIVLLPIENQQSRIFATVNQSMGIFARKVETGGIKVAKVRDCKITYRKSTKPHFCHLYQSAF